MLLERTDICVEFVARSGRISHKLVAELLSDSQNHINCSFSVAHDFYISPLASQVG